MAFLNPKNNIDRVLMYWQTEDLIRAYNFDIDKLVKSNAFKDDFKAKESVNWLRFLADKMKEEKVDQVGHTTDSIEIISALTPKHRTMLTDKSYMDMFEPLKPAINAYKKQKPMYPSDVLALFEIVYAYYLKRLGAGEITENIEKLGLQAAECLNTLANAE